MELSQTSLAMLLLGGFQVGLVLNITYMLTDMRALRQGFIRELLCNIKDFAFVLLAGLFGVFIVYYINDGEFRYTVLVGIIGGFAVSQALFANMIACIRDAIWRAVAVPVVWLWRITLGIVFSKIRLRTLYRSTREREEELMLLASNGFENERRQKHESG